MHIAVIGRIVRLLISDLTFRLVVKFYWYFRRFYWRGFLSHVIVHPHCVVRWRSYLFRKCRLLHLLLQLLWSQVALISDAFIIRICTFYKETIIHHWRFRLRDLIKYFHIKLFILWFLAFIILLLLKILSSVLSEALHSLMIFSLFLLLLSGSHLAEVGGRWLLWKIINQPVTRWWVLRKSWFALFILKYRPSASIEKKVVNIEVMFVVG